VGGAITQMHNGRYPTNSFEGSVKRNAPRPGYRSRSIDLNRCTSEHFSHVEPADLGLQCKAQLIMKTVLFCGGLGTRIRDYSENIPKPMIPIGGKPILWHLMSYYGQYGHKDFILCLGYKANVIKEFFFNYQPHVYADCVMSGFGNRVETLGDPQADWRVTMIDTGVWRNIGERLFAVRSHVENEEIFLANYSDGLSDVHLPSMIERFKQSGKIAAFVATRPSFSLHLVDMHDDGRVTAVRATKDVDLWINGGGFIFRREIFNYLRNGEELVEEPFQRLIEDDQLLAFRHDGFWRPMDTLKDKEVLEDLVDRGRVPWLVNVAPPVAASKVGRKAG
jgi:glucose-1-phosphate cytidylyltransferase